MNISQIATRLSGKTKLFLGNKGPSIMTVAGVSGLIATNILTVHATLKAEKKFPELKARIQDAKSKSQDLDESEKETARRLMKVYADNTADLIKIYWPSIMLGSVSTGFVFSAHRIMVKRNASLVAAYSALDVAYRAYRRRVAEAVGEEKELVLYRGIRIKNGTGEDGLPCEIDWTDVLPSPYARFFDEYNPHWSKTPEYNMLFLRSQQQWANDRLHAYGFIFLNEVYEALGMERSQAGQVVGWKLNGNGDGHVDFGLYDIFDESSRAFVNGIEPSTILDFNVDGPIRI